MSLSDSSCFSKMHFDTYAVYVGLILRTDVAIETSDFRKQCFWIEAILEKVHSKS